ncbi:Hydrolase [Bifiguratus adelaidae]|uniref:Hydrolase n=1 Tax=Bifiguratus adelaidae TaxID=1938954 RepID=A0A261Y218_9FUNG|nr:Hydrolase [Bifiguratus adelaidae]
MSTFKPFKLALVQLAVGADKQKNVAHAREKVLEASKAGANVVVLPECFNSPYGTHHFPEYAETIPGTTVSALADMAKQAKVYLIGGSIPERESGSDKLYNTCTIYNPKGEMIGKHRKVHLFDIDVPGKIRFQESETLSAGNTLTHVETEYGKLGIGICYDIRFPEITMIAARKGCIAMIYPAAFNMTTGPMHWELLQRARAVDNQMYVAACSPARDTSAGYVAWGHSTIVDPSGGVIATTEDAEDIVYADIDPSVLDSARKGIPTYTQRRFDVYRDVSADIKE